MKQEYIDFVLNELGGKIIELKLKDNYIQFELNTLRGVLISTKDDDIDQSTMIYIDRKDCFDKYRKCAIQLKLPSNKLEKKILDSYLKFLHQPTSFHFSDNYQYILSYNLDVEYYRSICADIISKKGVL